MTQSGGEISFLTSGIFPLQLWHSTSARTHTNSVYKSICVCLSVSVYERVGGRWWEMVDKNYSSEKCASFSGKMGKRALSKSCLAKTNKWVSQRRENILKLTDVSSPCICYYFHCQGALQRLSHHLATTIVAAIMFIFIVWGVFFFFRVREERHSGGLCLPLWWFMSREVRTLLLRFLHHFCCWGLTGTVNHRAWRLIPCLQLWHPVHLYIILFSAHVNLCQSKD